MGIKVVMGIKLPYAIQLEDAKDYLYEFNFEKFDKYHIKFLCNSEENEEIYNDYLDNDFCLYLKLVATYNALNYEEYPHKKIYALGVEDKYTVDLPDKETKQVFLEINKTLNIIIRYVRKKQECSGWKVFLSTMLIFYMIVKLVIVSTLQM